MIHRLLERLGVYFSSGDYVDQAAAARSEYFAATGELHDEDRDLFDARMESFLEWYVLERPLATGQLPVAAFLEGEARPASEEERDSLDRLCRTRRGLFLIAKVKDGQVVLEDLATKERLMARERRGTVGFAPKDLCEARLCPSEGAWMFTKTLLFHPRDASKTIQAAIKQCVKANQPVGDLAFRLARLHQRWHRLGHTTADRIYRDGLAREGLATLPAGRGISRPKPPR